MIKAIFSLFVLSALPTGCGAGVDCDPLHSPRCSDEVVEVDQPNWASAYGNQLELVDEATEIFSRFAPGRIDLTVSPGIWRYVHQNARLLDETTTFVEVGVSIDGEDLGAVGLRPKGGTGTLLSCTRNPNDEADSDSREITANLQAFSGVTCPKLSYKLKFDKFQEEFTYRGLRRLNLHSMLRDPSKSRDFLAYGLYRRMGVAAPRVNYAEVYINGDRLGLFAMIEEIDETFLASRFPDEPNGNLYKDVWLSGGTSAQYEARVKTNEDDADHSGFVRAREAFKEATDDTLPHAISHWLNVERFVSYIEVEQAMLNWDGPLSFRHNVGETSDTYRSHNFYLYHPSPTSKFAFIPWDMDNAMDGFHPRIDSRPDYMDTAIDCEEDGFEKDNRGERFYMAPSCDPLVRAAALSGSLDNRMRLLETVFTVDSMHELIDWQEVRLERALLRDRAVNLSDWAEALDDLKAAVELLVTRTTEFQSVMEQQATRTDPFTAR